jgi:putative endonuclease
MDYEFWVCVVASRTGTLYIGMTNNIERRMREHKSGEFEGFASKYGCNRLVYWESFNEVQEAINREKQLKGGLGRRRSC